MDIRKIQESIKITIIENFKKNSKPVHAPSGPKHQRPKYFGKGGKSGTERTQERRKGKQQASEMNEEIETGTSIFRPLLNTTQSPLSFGASRTEKPTRPLTGKKEKPLNPVQTELIKSVVAPERKKPEQLQQQKPQTEVNTEDTPQLTLHPTAIRAINAGQTDEFRTGLASQAGKFLGLHGRIENLTRQNQAMRDQLRGYHESERNAAKSEKATERAAAAKQKESTLKQGTFGWG